MKKETNKVKFSEKHPVLGLLLTTYGSFVVAQMVIGSIIAFPLIQMVGLDTTGAAGIGAVIGSLVVLAFLYKRSSPEYRFIPGKGSALGSFRLISPIILFWIILYGLYAIFLTGGKVTFAAISFSEIMACLMAGMSEEIIFREIAISYMTKHWKSEKMIPVIVGISGLLFSATHLTNVAGGFKVTDVLYQSALCIFFGFFFGAVYLRMGNVWVLAIVHVVHDMLVFSNLHGMEKLGSTELPVWTSVVIFLCELALGVYGYFLLRKSKREEIIKLWDYKWSRE